MRAPAQTPSGRSRFDFCSARVQTHRPFLKYYCDMLEELEQLERRVRSLVRQTRDLGEERTALRQQVTLLEKERDDLKQQVVAGQAELERLQLAVGQVESVVQQEKRRSQQEIGRL